MPRPYMGATCRGSIALGTGCGHCERCADERAKYNIGSLSEMDKATIRGAMLIASRRSHLAVSGAVSELIKIISRLTGETLYCHGHDGSWCRSLNGAARCSDCPVGNGNPTIVERIALDEGVRREGPQYQPPASETQPPISIGWPTPPPNTEPPCPECGRPYPLENTEAETPTPYSAG